MALKSKNESVWNTWRKAISGNFLQSLLACLLMFLSLSVFPSCHFKEIKQISDLSVQREEIIQYLENLKYQKSNRIISGQFISYAGEGFESRYIQQIEALKSAVGKSVAMIGADYRSFSCKTEECEADSRDVVNQKLIEHSKLNGFVTLSWHVGNPWDGFLHKRDSRDSLDNKFQRLADDLQKINPTDKKSRDAWLYKLDRVSEKLLFLKKNGVIVFWRPFHEMNGRWFWWGGQKVEAFQKIWKHMFEYFQKKKLQNLIWVFSPSSKDSKNIYPMNYYYTIYDKEGKIISDLDAFVDVIGIDKYMKKESISLEINGYEEIIKLGKPIGLSEFGPGPADMKIPTKNYNFNMMIDEIIQKYQEIVFFQAWHTPWTIIENGKEVLNHDLVITLDKVQGYMGCRN